MALESQAKRRQQPVQAESNLSPVEDVKEHTSSSVSPQQNLKDEVQEDLMSPDSPVDRLRKPSRTHGMSAEENASRQMFTPYSYAELYSQHHSNTPSDRNEIHRPIAVDGNEMSDKSYADRLDDDSDESSHPDSRISDIRDDLKTLDDPTIVARRRIA